MSKPAESGNGKEQQNLEMVGSQGQVGSQGRFAVKSSSLKGLGRLTFARIGATSETLRPGLISRNAASIAADAAEMASAARPATTGKESQKTAASMPRLPRSPALQR